MAADTLEADYRILGLTPDAGLEQIEAAFREQRSLWADDKGLATYALAEGDERDVHLARIDEAYRRLRTALLPVPEPRPAETPQPPPRPPAPHAPVTRDDLPPLDPESPGEWLRRCRERQGLELAEVASRTRIGRQHLEMIEAHRFEGLPARVYVRGFVLQYARELGAPAPEAVAEAFLARMADVAA